MYKNNSLPRLLANATVETPVAVVGQHCSHVLYTINNNITSIVLDFIYCYRGNIDTEEYINVRQTFVYEIYRPSTTHKGIIERHVKQKIKEKEKNLMYYILRQNRSNMYTIYVPYI